MGAAQTAGECDSDGHEWKQPTEDELGRWRTIQTKSCMIRQLSMDVDAQYHCYQPYLLLFDIIHLHRTCHLWRHWIHSPDSVAHRSQSHEHGSDRARNRADVATIRNSNELFQICRNPWIQPYLYGCRISPPINDRSNSWLSTPSIFQFRLKSPPPPLLTQLAQLKQIQHLTLDHVHPNEITSERIKAYFTALAPNLRSLELFPSTIATMEFDRLYGYDYCPVNLFLDQVHHLINLEELRVSIHRFSDLYCAPLPPLPTSLGKCIYLKHLSFRRYPLDECGHTVENHIRTFLLIRYQQTHRSRIQVVADGSSPLPQPDPLEFLDLSSICIRSDLWYSLVLRAPNLTTLDSQWHLAAEDWSLLRKFKQLRNLRFRPRLTGDTAQLNHFLNHLIQCTTIETLGLTGLKSPMSESELRSILSHLTSLTDLSLTTMTLESLDGFSQPNRLARLTMSYCYGTVLFERQKRLADGQVAPVMDEYFIRRTLPSIPSLTHLTLIESERGHTKFIGGEEEVRDMTRDLFQRQTSLQTAQLVERTYKRTDFYLDAF